MNLYLWIISEAQGSPFDYNWVKELDVWAFKDVFRQTDMWILHGVALLALWTLPHGVMMALRGRKILHRPSSDGKRSKVELLSAFTLCIICVLWLFMITGCGQATSHSDVYLSADDSATEAMLVATDIADTSQAAGLYDPFPSPVSVTSPGLMHMASHGTYRTPLPDMFIPLIEPELIELPDEGDGVVKIAIYHTSREMSIQSRIPAVVNLSMAVYSYPPNFFEGMFSDEVLQVHIHSHAEGTPGAELINSRHIAAGTLRGMEAEYHLPVQHYGTAYSKSRIFLFGHEIVMLQILGGGVFNGAEPDEVFSDSVGTAFLEGFVYTPL